MIGWIFWLKNNSVFTFLTQTRSKERNMSLIRGGKKNLEPMKPAHPQMLAFFPRTEMRNCECQPKVAEGKGR